MGEGVAPFCASLTPRGFPKSGSKPASQPHSALRLSEKASSFCGLALRIIAGAGGGGMNPPGSFRSPDERPHRNLTTHPQKVTTIKVKVILLARHIPLAVISHSRGRESTICALNDSFISFTCEVRGTHMRRPAQSPHRIVSSKTGRVRGFDPSAHGGDILQLICVVRDWLRANLEPNEKIPGGGTYIRTLQTVLASSSRILRGTARVLLLHGHAVAL